MKNTGRKNHNRECRFHWLCEVSAMILDFRKETILYKTKKVLYTNMDYTNIREILDFTYNTFLFKFESNNGSVHYYLYQIK